MTTGDRAADDVREPHDPDRPIAACSLCGRAADPGEGEQPLGWSADMIETSDGPRRRWVCPQCTRRYVRSIEAKLDQQWW